MTMWGGRFDEEPDELLRQLNDSFGVDQSLVEEDISGSMAWARALASAGIYTAGEAAQVVSALEDLRESCRTTELLSRAVAERRHEDVHSFVEAELIARVGDLGRRLHTGRSRNDQVATDLKLWMRGAFRETRESVLSLAGAFARRAAETADVAMPGYTHLKRAEPVTFGHWCLAWVEMLLRDADRFAAAAVRADQCPLGSAALAGSPLPLDRHAIATELGFSAPTANSIDAVSSRDAVVDWHHAVASLMSTLSRFAEDLIILSCDEFAYVALPDRLATGSSRMPQKKNPDLLELVRGLAARAIGDLTSILGVMKGIPLSYDKDLQLDKESLIAQRRMLALVLPALTMLVDTIALDTERMNAGASEDALLATAVADRMAVRGIPFRVAHEEVGRLFVEAERRGVPLREVGATGQITADDLLALTVEGALESKDVFGGTAPARVRQAAAAALARIESLSS